MQATPENLQALAGYLNQTLSTDYNVRNPAEKYLEQIEGTENYALLLLQLSDTESVDMTIRLAAAINFKNFVKRNWRVVEERPSKISAKDRDAVKSGIVGLMLKTPDIVQRQLSDAITIIGREDFPNNWQGLLQEMVGHFRDGDFHRINGVLRTAHSLTKRYRHEFKSQELWVEIKFVLDSFAAPFSELFQSTMQLASQHAQNPPALQVYNIQYHARTTQVLVNKQCIRGADTHAISIYTHTRRECPPTSHLFLYVQVLFSSLLLICKTFMSLTSQELPDHFAEKNLEPWMNHFHTLLTTDNKLLETDSDEEPGPLELVKAQICEIVAMFAQKYDDDFESYLQNFVQSIWTLLVTTDAKPKHDLLVSGALEFLASVCERPTYKEHFANESTLTSICEKVIVPNVYFRGSDEELFEDNPEEYVRRDLEGSDVGTRRYSACNLVRGLCRFFEGQVIGIFSGYITVMLQQYAQDPTKNWRAKDAALYLITAIAMRSKTTKHGITKTSELVNIPDIIRSQCVTELQKPDLASQPVLRADSIRFITTFRSTVPKELLVSCLPLIVVHLKCPSHVVHTYAAHCVEKMLMLRSSDNTPAVQFPQLQPLFETIAGNIVSLFKIQGSELNEYAMKCLLRAMSAMHEHLAPFAASLMGELTGKLTEVSQNPSKPHFNHYLFECISCIVRNTCKTDGERAEKFEATLFPLIENILVRDVGEFLPYVFQVLSLLLEVRPLPVPDAYMAIYPLLLTPGLWERQGNVPALVRLLQAFIEKAPGKVTSDDRLPSLLGVFQKLVASKTNDHEGFYLLGSLVGHAEPSSLNAHLKNILILLFQRLQSSKTTKYVKGLLVFFSLFAGRFGGPALVEVVESIQPQMFKMVVERLYLVDVQKVSRATERKICAVGITKLLTETPAMLAAPCGSLWTPLLQVLISLFELPEDDSVPADEHFIDIEDTPGYQTAFSQLVYAGTKEHDPFESVVPNTKAYLAQCLHKLSAQHPGQVPRLIAGLSDEATRFLQTYFQSANVPVLI